MLAYDPHDATLALFTLCLRSASTFSVDLAALGNLDCQVVNHLSVDASEHMLQSSPSLMNQTEQASLIAPKHSSLPFCRSSLDFDRAKSYLNPYPNRLLVLPDFVHEPLPQ